MLKKVYSNENILLKVFFQGRFNVVPETILIVVGTGLGAERFDRIFAQLIKRILSNLNTEVDILTDTYYSQNIKEYDRNSIICIGSGYSNSFTRECEEKKEFDLKRHETTAKVFTEHQPLIAFVYGRGVKETYEATLNFCKNKLLFFLDQWSSRYVGGGKTIEIPSNIEELLNEIIFTMSSLPFHAKERNNNQKVAVLEKKVGTRTFALVITLSVIAAIFTSLAYHFFVKANPGMSITIFLAILFGGPTAYAVYKQLVKK